MEARGGTEAGHDVSTAEADHHDQPNTSGQDVESGPSPTHNGDLAGGIEAPVDHGERRLELFDLESKRSTTPGDEKAGHQYDERAKPARRIGRIDQETHGSGPGQVLEGDTKLPGCFRSAFDIKGYTKYWRRCRCQGSGAFFLEGSGLTL